jgi:hypothetical protein
MILQKLVLLELSSRKHIAHGQLLYYEYQKRCILLLGNHCLAGYG